VSENFIVSARKYRPKDWASVVGQPTITSTLRSAIESNQIAQAYLFCGPRGVGKTTCARIFAGEINKHAGQEIEDLSFNLFELDAASNRGVDDMRSLTEQVRIPPQVGKYKVYIIDEVHMLSKDAFNAFLKTLEEPPPHAIFILATTEKHKIIPTILSRCQIFDFHRIEVNDIGRHLSMIAEKEGVTTEPEGLQIIAQKADGALRDALSIYDQLRASTEDNLTYANVIKNLNVLDYDYYFRITEQVLAEDISKCLLIFDEVLKNGFDGQQFIVGLGEHFRNLLVCKDEETLQLLEVGESVRQRYKEQAEASDMRLLVKALEFTNECSVQYRASKNQRLSVELTLMKLCSIKYNQDEKKKSFRLKPFRQVARSDDVRIAKAPAPDSQVKVSAENPVEYGTNQPNTRRVSKPLLAGKELTLVEEDEPIHQLIKEAEISKALDDSDSFQELARPKREFQREEFEAAWKEYAEKIRLEDKMSLFSTLNARIPEVDSEGKIIVQINNSVQEKEIDEIRPHIHEFLKAKLENYSLHVMTVLGDQAPTNARLYTDRDKFSAMKEINPDLEEFRKKLDLDLDF
jgi:DNA polymerase-3 subunit gamma/tau